MGDRPIDAAATDPHAPEIIPDETPALPAPGSVVQNRYEIVAPLGAGGMGAVFRARDRELGEEVALKVLLPDLLGSAHAVERFRREVKIARKIAHSNVCKVFDLGESQGMRFLTMELVPGESLRERLARGAVTREEALRVLSDVLEGLAAIHAQGVIHRDLKPENVVVRPDGRAILLDFGLARSPAAGADQKSAFAGTPAYMSPEQLRGEPLDARSDVFAAGVLAWELLSGKRPERPGIVPIEDLESESAIAKALAPSPEARWPTATAFLTALRATPDLTSPRADDVVMPLAEAPRRTPVIIGAALAAALALILLWPSRPPERPAIEVTAIANLTGDPALDPLAGAATETIRAAVRARHDVSLGGEHAAASVSGSVQRLGDALRISVQFHRGTESSPPIEVDGSPRELIALLTTRASDELLILARDLKRRAAAASATEKREAAQKLAAYYDVVGLAPGEQHLEVGRRLLDEALALDPDYAPALNERAYLSLIKAGAVGEPKLLAEGLADVARAVALDPTAPEPRVLRCRALQFALEFENDPADRDVQEAFRACEDALAADPDSGHARVVLARLEDRRCRDEVAMETLTRALDVDRTLRGRILEHLVTLSMQNSRTAAADRYSKELVEHQEEERRLGSRAPSQRAGVPPTHGAHVLRAGVLIRAGKPEQAEEELEAELADVSHGLGDQWAEAASIRGLMVLAAKRGAELPRALADRLRALEDEFRASKEPAMPSIVASAYQWIDIEAAAEWLRAGTPTSCVDAIGRAAMLHDAGRDAEAHAALDACTRPDAWARSCVDRIRAKLAPR